MWIGLSGPPQIGGVEYGGQASVDARAVDESIVERRRGGLLVVIEERYRIEGSIVWRGLSEGEALALQSDIGQTCTLDLRTAAAADETWAAELAVDVLRTSDVELVAPLRPYDAATGRPLAGVSFSWRSLATYTRADLGLDVGGFDLISES